MNLYIYEYNNYYNRMFKKAGDKLADYSDYLYYGPVTGVYGFTPGDGVNTTQLIGTNVQPYYDGKGDYLIVHNPSTNEIDSRWFIVDHNRTRDGQWQLILHRDLVADFYDSVADAPMYIEKAILQDNDDLIYNSEQLNVNQIKKSQELLKDETNSAWLVGYLSAKPQEPEVTFDATLNIDYDTAIESIEDWDLYPFSNLTSSKHRAITNMTNQSLSMNIFHFNSTKYDKYTFPLLNVGRASFTTLDYGSGRLSEFIYSDMEEPESAGLSDIIYRKVLDNKNTIKSVIETMEVTFLRQDVYSKYNGKVIKDLATGKYYNVKVNLLDPFNMVTYITPGSNRDLTLVNCFDPTTWSPDPEITIQSFFDRRVERNVNANDNYFSGFEFTSYGQEFEVILDEIKVVVNAGSIPNTTKVAKDAPYKIFAMPYKLDGKFNFKVGDNNYSMSKEQSMTIMTKLITDYSGSGVLYDAQILPYCPVKKFINELGEFDLNNVSSTSGASPEGLDYILVKDADENVNGFIAFCDYSSFTAQIDYSIPVDNIKISNECDKYRLCAPSFNGSFDLNIAKNKGLTGFIVACTYKPYQPYIKVAPIFSGLYGQNFTDPRGLICGGDFGLPMLSDKWSTYEINNKNYLNSFDRQIQNMEITQDIKRKQDYWSVGAGTLSGAASGAFAGAAMSGGNPYAALAGGIVGGATSLAGGLQDIYYNEQLRTEALDYTKDQFNYDLENIQALPYTLSRVSSLTTDNTIYPVLEYYSCTDREKRALAEKIAWNGMTVMAIGKMNDYIGNTWAYGDITSKGYIKGKLIRLDDINEDFHIINALSGELNKGVYIQ